MCIIIQNGILGFKISSKEGSVVPKGFPTCSNRKLLKIIEKYCVRIQSRGSHVKYESKITGKRFIYSTNKKDFKTSLVRKILVGDIGLTEEQAKEELK